MGEAEIENSYKNIILKLKSLSVDEEVFKQKKHNFRQEIDSPRRLFLMSSIGDLIDYLERKLLVRNNKIRLITKILDVFEIFGIRKLIIEHNMLLTNYNYTNDRIDYKEDNARHQNITSDHSIPPCVVELISSRIGNSWKEMAYELQFKAGEIDLIDENLENDVKKSLKILNTTFQDLLRIVKEVD
uniref:Death domain-containing protein n=1 Tax=Rhodnius prolixus TaxID=13249 RepID=T1IC38_RHOPR